MENVNDGQAADHAATPPRAPNPAHDGQLRPHDMTSLEQQQTNEPLFLHDENWDIFSISAMSALMMLIQSVQALANMTGEIPPTPPVSRPVTPRSVPEPEKGRSGSDASVAGDIPYSPVLPKITPSTVVAEVTIGSPEAQRDEPIPAVEVGANAQAVVIQNAAISRRFYLKVAPSFSLSDYLLRIHRYCPHSPGVYLAAAAYIHRLCVSDTLVPATSRTIHRLCLSAIRIASKTFEDNKWPQERYAKVGGTSLNELQSLEINLCFLLSFELFVREEAIRKHMFQLQQTARAGIAMSKRLSDGFRMRLPVRQRLDVQV